jgi:hypothetical protein
MDNSAEWLAGWMTNAHTDFPPIQIGNQGLKLEDVNNHSLTFI